MSDPGQLYRAREEALAQAQAPLDNQSLATIARRARGLRRRRAGFTTTAALAGVVVLATAGMLIARAMTNEEPALPAPSASPSPTMTPSPSPSPSRSEATVEPVLLDGFAPVAQLPASEIPWDELEPGWFLIDFRSPEQRLPIDYDTFTWADRTGGLSLVSPDGVWYAVSTHAQFSPGAVMAWDGGHVWMTTTQGWSNGESELGALEQRRLLDGTVVGTAEVGLIDANLRTGYIVNGTDRAISFAYGGDGMSMLPIGAGAGSTETCNDIAGYYGVQFDDMSFMYSPGSGGQLVCFAPAAENTRTDVVVVNANAPGTSRSVSRFRLPMNEYAFLGWTDEEHFLVGRAAESQGQSNGMNTFDAVFEWSLVDDSIEEVNAPFMTSESNTPGFFDLGSQRFVVFSQQDNDMSLSLFTRDGLKVADIPTPCPGRWPSIPDRSAIVSVGGKRLMVTCEQSGYVRLYSTDSGALVGEWDVGIDHEVRPFDFPTLVGP